MYNGFKIIVKQGVNSFTFKIAGGLICIFFFILSSVFVQAQHNFVPNWSFEDTLHCPTGTGCPIINVKLWYTPTPETPDYYNACSFYCNVPGNFDTYFQYARNGVSFAGLFLWNKTYYDDRDYIQISLNDTLVKNKWYCAGFWISKTEISKYAVRNAGMFISKSPVGSSTITYLPYTPQISYTSLDFLTDTANWVLISGSFQAQGGEKYVTIGNFNNDENTDTLRCDTTDWKPSISYYLVDAVFLYDCDSTKIAEAGSDITICRDNSVVLGSTSVTGCKYKWTPVSCLNNDTIAQPVANPQVTTTYYLTLTDPFYKITTDSVIVIVNNDCYNSSVYIPNIFSPNSDGNNDVLYVRSEHIKELNFSVFNRWGEKVFESQNKNEGWDGNYKGKPCSPDVYVYHATIVFDDGTETSRKGNVTLVR